MMILASVGQKARKLIYIGRCGYHIEDLMKRNVYQRKPLLYAPANQLYVDSIKKLAFNEKRFIRILLEQQKIDDRKEIYIKLLNTCVQNLNKVENFKTISMLLLVAYEIKLDNKEWLKAIALRGFEILKTLRQSNEQKTYSYEVTRMLISISRLVGLRQFKNQHYNQILVNRLKPLFLTYILQLFWQINAQDEYQLPKKLIENLHTYRVLIPFSDVHHMIMARKIIKDPRFNQIIHELQNKLSFNVKNQNDTHKIDPQVVSLLYTEYANDLKAKYL